MNTQTIHVSNLSVDQFNPRRSVDSKAIRDLADNIHANGVLSPLLVRPALPEGVEPLDASQSKYTVLCGSRRLQAAKEAGLSSLPCVVRSLTDVQAAELALTEQSSHETLTLLELAEHLSRWKEAGASVEEIGQRMGRRRAWVFATIQLTTLTPEAKRAVSDNRLADTTARDLATVPASAQGAALKRLLEPSLNGGPLTSREARDVIASFRRDLTHAPFDPNDASLKCVEHDGACETCPFRSGTKPDLFDDNTSPNLCTSPRGYESRAEDAWARRVEDGKYNRGPECLSDEQTKRYFNGVGALLDDVPYVEADAVAFEDLKQRTYKQLLGPSYQQFVVLARVPKKLDVVELIGKQGLQQRLDESGKIKRREAQPKPTAEEKSKLSAEEKREQAKRAARREAVVKKAIIALVQKVEQREPGKRFWRTLADALVHTGGLEEIWRRRDVQIGPSQYLDKLDEAKLRGFVWESLLEFELYREEGRYPERLVEQAKEYGVDLKTLEREVVAEERAKPEVKKKGKAA